MKAFSATPRLFSVGSAVVDVSIQGLKRFPLPDTEFSDRSDVQHDRPARLLLGGTALNTAMVYAALTGSCELGGVVGDDWFGNFLIQGLTARHVTIVGQRGGATATHTIALGINGERQAYWHPGTPLDVAALLDVWIPSHVFLTGINLCFARPLVDSARALGQAAHSAGFLAILDIGQGGPGALDLDEIMAIAADMDLLLGSETEFAAVLGCGYTQGRGILRERFGGPVILKVGARGAVVDPGPRGDLYCIPGYPTSPVNPIGAGDAFAGGFLSGWLSGLDLEASCRRGNAAGSISVGSVFGPQDVTKVDVTRAQEVC